MLCSSHWSVDLEGFWLRAVAAIEPSLVDASWKRARYRDDVPGAAGGVELA